MFAIYKLLVIMKKLILLIIFTVLFIFPQGALAAEVLTFDSTDHYLGACQLTDKSEWTLINDLAVTKFQVWYNWDQGETSLPVTVTKDGAVFAEFTATRADCDPYQQQWCNADFQINKTFPSGTYQTKIPTAKQCLKPGGTGAIRLYGEDDVATVEPLLTTQSAPTNDVVCAPCPTPISACKNPTSQMIITSVVTFFVTLVLSSFIFKRKSSVA